MSTGISDENGVRSESNKYSMIPILFSGEGLFEPELGSAEDGEEVSAYTSKRRGETLCKTLCKWTPGELGVKGMRGV